MGNGFSISDAFERMNDNVTQQISPQPTHVVDDVSYTNNTQQLPKIKGGLAKKHLVQIISFSALIVLSVVSVAVYFLSQSTQDIRSRASLSGASLSLVPATKDIKSGDTFQLGVMMNTSTDTVSAVDLSLSYDPNSVQISKFNKGTPLPIILVPEKYSNGVATVTLGCQPTSPYKGTAVIGTYEVKILNSTNSEIKILRSTIVTGIGKKENILATVVNTSLNGTGVSANLTPTPTGSTTLITTTTPSITPMSTPTSSVTFSVLTTSLPSGKIGKTYESKIEITKTKGSGNPDVTISGLPFGVYQSQCTESTDEASVSCTISGTPVRSGKYGLNVSVVGENNAQTSKTLNFEILN